MKSYEMMYIIPSQSTEEEKEALIDLVKKDCFEVIQRDKNYLFINQYK